MQSIPTRAFLSHKFDDRIDWLIELVQTICNSLDIACENVDHSSSNLPIDEAQTIIENSNFLIALCTRDKEFSDGKGYSISNAVQQEITLAYKMQKPIALFAEEGVNLGGFYENMCTYDRINIENNMDTKLIEQLCKGIHREKVKSISENQFEISQEGTSHFYLENCNLLIKLTPSESGNLTWKYVLEKKYVFNSQYQFPLKFGAWAMNGDKKSEVSGNVEIIESNKEFKHIIIENSTINSIHFTMTLDPFPKEGDFIKIRESISSDGLNLIFSDDSSSEALNFREKSYNCIDGFCVTTHCKELSIRIFFPKGYKLDINDVTPIVGTFSHWVNYVIEREVDRIISNKLYHKKVFNDEIELSLDVSDPLYQHFYGFAWNPPYKN